MASQPFHSPSDPTLRVAEAPSRVREIAREIGFDHYDQVCLATAVWELLRHAREEKADIRLLSQVAAGSLQVRIEATAPNAEGLWAAWEGRDAGNVPPALSVGKLVDRFHLGELRDGTLTAVLELILPAGAWRNSEYAAEYQSVGIVMGDDTPGDTAWSPSTELVAALVEARHRRHEASELRKELAGARAALDDLTTELAETNRGMLALYSELDAQAEQLRRTSELKSRFLRHVTHELRTPVGSTLRLCQLLLDRIDGDLTAEQEHQVNLIRRSSETLADLVNDLLDLAKIEAGKTELHPAWVDVGELFVGLRGMLRPLVPAEVALVFESPSGLPPLYTDEGKLSQILRNFVSNALKFTERGEVRVSAVALPELQVRFSVADSGIGIAAEDQERIFEEFGQVSSAVQQRLKGTGLGLPLSKSLAELLGGAITLESAPGQGSVFSVTLPATLPGAAPDPPERSELSPPQAARLEKLLIIDDDEAARYVLRRMVESCADEIVEASSGLEGLELARDQAVRLILLDLAMPDLDGRDVLRQLKKQDATRPIPVIVVTSRNLDAQERADIEAEAIAVVSKFAPPLEVAAQLQQAFERAGLRFQPTKGGR